MDNPELITAIACIVLAAGSELIGLNKKWKSNSIVQLIMVVARAITGRKTNR